jgi:putative oxidoreductase
MNSITASPRIQFLASWLGELLCLADALRWLPPLLFRLFVGYMFFELGWAKLQNLEGFAERFAGWGIPYPAFSAALSAYTECIGGALLVVGLFTRIASIPLIINMVVAIATVKMARVGSLEDFVELDEPLYILGFFWLLIAGPGGVSLDYLVKHFLLAPLGLSGEAATRTRRGNWPAALHSFVAHQGAGVSRLLAFAAPHRQPERERPYDQ